MRTKRVERLIKLLRTLQNETPMSVDALTDAIGVSRRTIFRDLDILNRAGIPYTYERNTQTYTAQNVVLLPPVSLTHAEALALLMAADIIQSGPYIVDPAVSASASEKLRGMLPCALRENCEGVMKNMAIFQEPSENKESLVDMLPVFQHAVSGRLRVRIRYDSYFERKVIETTLHPYHLAFIRRSWYIIAFSELHEEIRTFKMERILGLKRLTSTFRIDPGFSVDGYFGNAWMMIRGANRYHVRIRFFPKVAGNVDEVHWHKTQRTSWRDGCLIFEADVDGVDEIAWWVLGYGDQAEVLEPPELQEIVCRHARGILDYYEKSASAREDHANQTTLRPPSTEITAPLM